MVEKLKKAIEELQTVKEFKDFKKKNPKSYLVSCMVIIDGDKIGDWQIDYYQPDTHKMATFILKDEIELKGEDGIFQKEKAVLKELKLEEVKIGLDKMLKLVEDIRKEKYPGEFPNKIISVLQTINDKVVWNLTHLTSTLKIWNIRLDAKNGELIEDNIENVFSLKAS